MRIALFLGLIPLYLLAQSYFARLEPDRTLLLSSTVAAQVAAIDEQQKGQLGTDRALIRFQGEVTQARLAAAKTQVQSLERTLQLREEQYARNRQLSSVSRRELEGEEMAILELKSQLAQAKERHVAAQEAADGLEVYATGRFVDRILVQEGEYVAQGQPLAQLYDLSRARAVIFVPIAQARTLKEKEIMVDGQKSDFSVDRIWSVADERHISSYRVELVGPPPEGGFSRLVEIEFIPKERR